MTSALRGVGAEELPHLADEKYRHVALKCRQREGFKNLQTSFKVGERKRHLDSDSKLTSDLISSLLSPEG